MAAHQHDQHRAEQIGGKRRRRDRFDLIGLDRRPEGEAAHDEQACEDEADDDVEVVRRDHRRAAVQAGQGPEQRKDDGRDRKPAPQADARQRQCGRGDDGEIDIERPVVGLFRRHQQRRDKAGGDAEARQRRPMQQRGRERAERDHAEQDEGGGGRDETVERVGGVDGGKRHRGAGRGQDRRNVGDRQRDNVGNAFLAPRPFAGAEQRECKQAAQRNAYVRTKKARLDRVTHQEEAAERERKTADPDHPAGAEPFLEAGLVRRQRRWRGACRSFSLRWRSFGGHRGSRLGRSGWRRRRGLLELRQRWWRRPGSRRDGVCLKCFEPLAQPRDLLLGLAGKGERGDRNHQRNQVDGRIEHGASETNRMNLQRRPRTRRPGAGRSCNTSRRKRNSAAGRPPVCVDITPVGSTRVPASTSLRKFCLCR